ncbi:hypothetical protein [Streptomyces resistomycificus]|nr:hypothetical protein [Streptomyces resistomycificus]
MTRTRWRLCGAVARHSGRILDVDREQPDPRSCHPSRNLAGAPVT